MPGTKYSGNPNIKEDTKGKSTGPISLGGKLKVSMNASKNLEQSKEIDVVLKELGIKFKKTSEALTLKKSFRDWFISKTGKDLTEIDRLGELINILESDVAVRTMKKLEEGIPLNDEDVRIIKLLKETLETSHKLKFGDKHLHAHVGYDDIRKMMFDDNP